MNSINSIFTLFVNKSYQELIDMKARKKPLGMKHRIREERKREERIGLVVLVATLIAIIFISGFLINSMLNQPSQPVNAASESKAAIVDHLSRTYPNQTFTETATNALKQAGYIVDYYPGEEVTVEFYKNLPTHGYSLIILRVHSTISRPGTPQATFLFSSEPYTKTRYVFEQLTDRVVRVAFVDEGPFYFGISPLFISNSMQGRFENTIIIMMGCAGLEYPPMAEAFIEKGAKVYISWSKSVLASYTDTATMHLLLHLISEKRTIKQAVDAAMKDVGANPAYDSLLLYYPLEAGSYTVQSIVSTPGFVNTIDEIKHKESLGREIHKTSYA